jgi:hypothetical protein
MNHEVNISPQAAVGAISIPNSQWEVTFSTKFSLNTPAVTRDRIDARHNIITDVCVFFVNSLTVPTTTMGS